MKRFLQLQLPKELHSFAVGLGGAFGALSRAGIDSLVANNILAVLICNLLGTFTLSAAISYRARPLSELENLISIGFCGGFSIFATFSKVSVKLLKSDEYLLFAVNGAANIILCVWAVYLAEAMMTALFPRRGDALNDNMMKAEMQRQAIGNVELNRVKSELVSKSVFADSNRQAKNSNGKSVADSAPLPSKNAQLNKAKSTPPQEPQK